MTSDIPPLSRRLSELLIELLKAASIPILAVVLAALIGAGILAVSNISPWQAYLALYQGSFGSPTALARTLEKATPLIFTGLAVAFAFKAGLFNIGAQGQLLCGAITAAAIGFGLRGLPMAVHLPLALAGGALAGALYALIPGVLKSYTGAHEVITTIMLNYVTINLTDYLANGPFKDSSPGNIVARTPEILSTARLPTVGSIPSGFVLALVAAGLVWWLLWQTTLGFEIRTVGLNPHVARYAGIRVALTIILTMVLSGLLASFGGAVETLGVVGRFEPGFNAGLGFDGITIALLGKTHPLGVIPAALLVGAMKAGSNQMQFTAGVAPEITDVIQALILFFVAADVMIRWVLRNRAAVQQAVTLGAGWGKQ